MDRIAHLTAVPLMRLVDWKNRAGEPFELRCKPLGNGAYLLDLNTPVPTSVASAIPLVHGDYESRKEDDGTIVYKALPGNSMGQVLANDGRPAFGVAYDVTEMDGEGRPVFKVYFGTATEWFVKNVYHQKWNDLREAKRELEPDAEPAKPIDDAPRSKEAGRNPRDRARNEQRGQGGGNGGGRSRRGRRGGRGRS